MSKFVIDNEGISDLANALCRDIYQIVAPHASLEAVKHFVAESFRDELINGSQGIVEAVTIPAVGAGNDGVGVRISDTFRGRVTIAAKNRFGIISH